MTLTQIACLGLSHRTAPVAVREQLRCAFPEQGNTAPEGAAQAEATADVVAPLERSGPFAAIRELALVSTCNRVELYAVVADEIDDVYKLLLDYLSSFHPGKGESYADSLYFFLGRDAIVHLARVACSLDSLVLGEPQILGQVNSAYLQAARAGTTGPVLTALFRSVVRAGKRARTETAIGNSPSSISSVAITLAQKVAGDLTQQRILLIGAGEMGQLALSALRKRGLTNIAVANRSRERAERMVGDWGGQAYSLEELPAALADADVVISATGAPHTVLDVELVEAALAARTSRPLILIDVAVPRDIEPAVGKLPGVCLYDMDALREGLDEAVAARTREIPQVEMIVAEEVAALESVLRSLQVQPLIVDLRQRAEAIRQRELERTLRYIGEELDPDTLRHVQHLSRSLVNKLLHEPTIRLREKASNGEAEGYAETVRELFDLTTDA